MQNSAGKGKLLDIVNAYDSKVCGRYIRLSGNDPQIYKKAISFMKETNAKAYMLRSDALCENSFGKSFSGFFDSLDVTAETFELVRRTITLPHDLAKQDSKALNLVSKLKEDERNQALNDARKIMLYNSVRGGDIVNSQMDFILHEKFDFQYNLLISEHPNIDGAMHIEFFPSKARHEGYFSSDFVLDAAKHHCIIPGFENLVQHFVNIRKYLPQDYAYMAEAGTSPNHIVQLRPYFKKEIIKGRTNPGLLGFVPATGMEFMYDPSKTSEKDKSYENYHYSGLGFVREFNHPKSLPLDVDYLEHMRLIYLSGRSPFFLTHAGINNIEAADVVFWDYHGFEKTKSIKNAKKVRFDAQPSGYSCGIVRAD